MAYDNGGALSRNQAFHEGSGNNPEHLPTTEQQFVNPYFHSAGVETIANTFQNVNGESESTFGNPNASHGDPYAKAMQDQLHSGSGELQEQ